MSSIWQAVQEIIFERLVGFQKAMPSPLRKYVQTRQALAVAEMLRKQYDIPKNIHVPGNGKPGKSITVLSEKSQNEAQDVIAILTVSPEKFVEMIKRRKIRVICTLLESPTQNSEPQTLRVFWATIAKLRIVTNASFEANEFFRDVVFPAYEAQVRTSVKRRIRIDEFIQWLENQAYAYYEPLYKTMALSIIIFP